MRLITWNVAGRVTRQPDQAAAVLAVDADVVCLQEVTASSAPLWEQALAGHTTLIAPLTGLPRRRPLGVLIAARAPIDEVEPPDVPWPERVLVARTGGVEIVNLHSPISPTPGFAKVLTHEAVAAYLKRDRPPLGSPRILCGDLNTPRREYPGGEVMTFAYGSNGRFQDGRDERWDAAERALIRGLGWTDAFRALHGFEQREPSWTYPRGGGGYRLDHVLVDGLEPSAAVYLHDLRTSRLSDHSALVVDLVSDLVKLPVG